MHYYYILDFVSFIQHDGPHCLCVVCVCVMKYPRLRSHLLATYYGSKQSAWLGTYVVSKVDV